MASRPIGTYHEQDDLGGGRYQFTAHIKPVAYPKAGSFEYITNAMGATGDEAFPVGLSELANFRMSSRLAGQSPILHFGRGNSMVRLTALGTRNVNGQAQGANGWVYPEAWSNADLLCSAYGHKFAAGDVILRAGHPAAFEFRVDDHAGLDYATLATPDFRIDQPALVRDGSDPVPLAWQTRVQGGKLILRAELPVGNWAGWVLDPTLTLQPGAAAGKDTLVGSGGNAANNYGIYQYILQVISHKALVQFDVSAIPAVAVCTSSPLTLYKANTIGSVAWTITARSIAVGNVGWPEGTKNGAAGGAGDCCWNFRDQGGAGTPWAGAAGLATSGADFEPTVLATVNGNSGDVNGTAYTLNLTASRVQGWFGAINTNYGLILTPSTTIGGIASSDHATAAWRPTLTVNYFLPGGARGIATGGLLGARGIATGGRL